MPTMELLVALSLVRSHVAQHFLQRPGERKFHMLPRAPQKTLTKMIFCRGKVHSVLSWSQASCANCFAIPWRFHGNAGTSGDANWRFRGNAGTSGDANWGFRGNAGTSARSARANCGFRVNAGAPRPARSHVGGLYILYPGKTYYARHLCFF